MQPRHFVDGRSLRQLLRVRQGLEAGWIGMVADRITAADLETRDTLVEEMAGRSSKRLQQ